MNITKESTGDLTATIKIEIVPSDYSAAVEKQITDYKKKANIPGFRPGHVPVGMIKKMYGKAVLADEVNRLISDSLLNYIKEEKLDILGNPVPNLEKNSVVDFDNSDSFDFFFDIGYAPKFSIPLDEDMDITSYTIAVTDEMVNKYVEDTRKRYGKPITKADDPEEATIITDDSEKPVENEEAAKEPEVEPAELNEEFFEMVYPGMEIKTEEDFLAQVRNDASSSFSVESDKMLFNSITEALVNKTEMQLPDAFLKLWLADNNEGKFTPEQIEAEYPSFVESMKWQLIENKILKDNNIEVTDQDIRSYISTYMFRQMNLANLDPEMQKRYESIIDTFMQNKEQVQRINDQLYNAKMMEFFKTRVKVHPKEVSYDEYIALASAMHKHGHEHHEHHEHDHDHNHDHDHDHDHHHDH